MLHQEICTGILQHHVYPFLLHRELNEPVYSPPEKRPQLPTPEKGPATKPGAPPLPPHVSWSCWP